MANRKLVEIQSDNYRALQRIRRLQAKANLPVPSMPFLVNQGLRKGMNGLKECFPVANENSK